ncbi:hypothetical protein B0J13DRAFT_588767 [Dactylonectria estremocensis]|uniref:Nucleoporin NUP53 n=1 Tax=Dactylonectria estremocensis TaxID=1079267 RepID=A0A9P9DVY8_9HYPO|nr:hypothetical protein B0J13DRAFT_588767 [Dactylonectria estremocensis]
MAPLILHNVPDDECYVGDDGVKRPYAMYFNQQDAPSGNARSRRGVAESGSFGKSTRRSRSRPGTPARNRENPTLAAADKLFGDWVSNQAVPAATLQRKSSGMLQEDPIPQRAVVSSPVELILRGYRSSTHQYAAISHYESLAGSILEDYPREPPASQRRYKSELRDPGFTRRRTLSADERALVNRADGGEHWVKVTFESSEAADAAMFASPQRILGHLVYAEGYRGLPPAKDEACPDVDAAVNDHARSNSMPAGVSATRGKSISSMPTSFNSRLLDLSPPHSQSSSLTMDTGTIANSHTSSATVTETIPTAPQASTSGIETLEIRDADSVFCRRIPTARRVNLLPAEQALLPQQSVMQRFLNAIPFIKWFGGSMIGNEVPRTEIGEFDWNRASLYWKLIWWLDATFGLFGGDVLNIDKDD